MATVATTSVQLAGTSVPFSAASAGGDAGQTGPAILLLVKNGDASAHTVTLTTPGTVNGLAIADRAVAVPAGSTVAVPLTNDYRDGSTGLASWSYDAVTSVSVAVVSH